MDIVETIKQVGIPTAVAIGLGWGGWKIIQFLLNDLIRKLQEQKEIIIKLIEKVSALKSEILVIHTKIDESHKHIVKIEENGNGDHSAPPRRKRK